MAFGVICACCGKEEELPDDAGDLVYTCQPCDGADDSTPDLSVHTIPQDTSVVVLDATEAFGGLTAKEASYALALAQADWDGAKICLIQTSPESAIIFAMLQLVFCTHSTLPALPMCPLPRGCLRVSPTSGVTCCAIPVLAAAQPLDDLVAAAKAKGLSDDEIAQVLMYSAAFYGNLGNYKSFGDTVGSAASRALPRALRAS